MPTHTPCSSGGALHTRYPLVLPLLVLTLVVTQMSTHMAHGAPMDLLLERSGSTYAFMVRRQYDPSYYSYVIGSLNSFGPSYDTSTDVSIYTPEMQQSVVNALQSYAYGNRDYIPYAYEAFAGNTQGINAYYCLKAYLRVSTVGECPPNRHPLCCVNYWVTDTQGPHLPSSQVRPETVFWDGTQTVNGFFTNFTADTIAAGGCNDTPPPPFSAGRGLAIDFHGQWAYVNNAQSVYSMREMNVATSSDGNLRKQAAEMIASARDVVSKNLSSEVVGATFNVPLAAPIIVAAVLVVVLLVLLIVFACKDGYYRARIEEAKRFAAAGPRGGSCNRVVDVDDNGGATEMYRVASVVSVALPGYDAAPALEMNPYGIEDTAPRAIMPRPSRTCSVASVMPMLPVDVPQPVSIPDEGDNIQPLTGSFCGGQQQYYQQSERPNTGLSRRDSAVSWKY